MNVRLQTIEEKLNRLTMESTTGLQADPQEVRLWNAVEEYMAGENAKR